MSMPVETLAESMYQLIAEYAGKKNLKPGDLVKAMIAKHGEAECRGPHHPADAVADPHYSVLKPSSEVQALCL